MGGLTLQLKNLSEKSNLSLRG